MIANHAFGPPSENLTSANFGFISIWTGWTDSTSQQSAKASYNSCRDTRRGPSFPGSWSLKHKRNSRPPRLDHVRQTPDVAPPVFVGEDVEQATINHAAEPLAPLLQR